MLLISIDTHIARNGQGTQGSWRDIYEQEFGPKKVFGVNAAAAMITRKFIDAQPFDQPMTVALAARSTSSRYINIASSKSW